jgi:hypothetical protein
MPIAISISPLRPADISEEDALAKLLELNLDRAGAAQEPSLLEEPDDED